MAEKTRYSDAELEEFRAIIMEKLELAQRDYEQLKKSLMGLDGNDTDDTSPTYKVLEEGANTLSKEETTRLAQRQLKFIQGLQAALVRIENKTYGICRETGKLIPAGETVPDLRTPVLVDGLSLDHVYTDCPAGAYAEIFYKDCKVKLEATEEFGHIVVFTPDAPFFCVENQSCSTDCFNLFAKGYARESGLQAVHAGQKKSGEVRFVFEKQD